MVLVGVEHQTLVSEPEALTTRPSIAICQTKAIPYCQMFLHKCRYSKCDGLQPLLVILPARYL